MKRRVLFHGQRYNAAKPSRLEGNWVPLGGTVNSLIAAANPMLRERTRDLIRNFPPFSRAVSAHVAFVVGRGARFQSLATGPDGQSDEHLRQKIEFSFRRWMDHCDLAGKLHFYEFAQLAVRQELECGEALIRFAIPRGEGRPLLALDAIEPDRLNGVGLEPAEPGCVISQGIEYDSLTGEPVAYHVSGSLDDLLHATRVVRCPASDIIHLFSTLRPGQLRGVTPFAPAILLAHDLGDYTGAELDSAKLAAKWLGFVTSPDIEGFQAARGIRGAAATDTGRVENLENAIIEYLRSGEKVEFAPSPNRAGDSFDRFVKFVLRFIAIASETPYEILSGDYSGINYSTSKAIRNDFQVSLYPRKFRMERHFYNRVFRRWLAIEALSADYLSGYWEDPDRFAASMWIPAGTPSVDPQRDGKAAIDAIKAGLTSPQQVIMGNGQDPEEVLAQNVEWAARCRKAGISFDLSGIDTSLASNPAAVAAADDQGEEGNGSV